MSEKLFRFLLSELQLIRLRCKKSNCGGVAELPVSRLSAMTGTCRCPSCGETFMTRENRLASRVDSLTALGVVIQELIASDTFDVEFVIPEPASKPA